MQRSAGATPPAWPGSRAGSERWRRPRTAHASKKGDRGREPLGLRRADGPIRPAARFYLIAIRAAPQFLRRSGSSGASNGWQGGRSQVVRPERRRVRPAIGEAARPVGGDRRRRSGGQGDQAGGRSDRSRDVEPESSSPRSRAPVRGRQRKQRFPGGGVARIRLRRRAGAEPAARVFRARRGWPVSLRSSEAIMEMPSGSGPDAHDRRPRLVRSADPSRHRGRRRRSGLNRPPGPAVEVSDAAPPPPATRQYGRGFRGRPAPSLARAGKRCPATRTQAVAPVQARCGERARGRLTSPAKLPPASQIQARPPPRGRSGPSGAGPVATALVPFRPRLAPSPPARDGRDGRMDDERGTCVGSASGWEVTCLIVGAWGGPCAVSETPANTGRAANPAGGRRRRTS